MSSDLLNHSPILGSFPHWLYGMLTLSQALCVEFTQRAFYLTGRETIPVPGSVIMGLHIKHGQAENREEVSVAKEASGPKAGSWDWEGPQRRHHNGSSRLSST